MRVVGLHVMTSRHFTKALPDYKPGVSITFDRSKFARHTKQTLDRILEDASALNKPSVYTAGIAYALCHILRNPNTLPHIPNAPLLAQKAVEISNLALSQHRRHPSGSPWSLCFGESGAHLVAAFAHQIAGNCMESGPKADLYAAAARYIENFIHYGDIAASAACHEDEFLYGRAGYLMGALLINNYFSEDGSIGESIDAHSSPAAAVIPSTLIEKVARMLLSSGKQQAISKLPLSDHPEYNTPLWWEWHGSPYLGAAHGSMGILFVLLKLYKETKDEKWLYRAIQFAEFIDSKEFLEEARVPDHPNSLFEGAAAAACLYADLMEPANACLPLFDLLKESKIK